MLNIMTTNDFFKILSYEEVASFGKAQRNRKVTPGHVNDFVNVIKDGKSRINLEDGTYLVFGLMPIVINPLTGHILEGQHKHEAFIKAYENGIIDENARMLVAFWEVEGEEAENTLIIDLNSKSKTWAIGDYMDCYAQYKDTYTKLRTFCEKHTLCHEVKKDRIVPKYRYAAAMLTGRNCSTLLKSGSFSYTDIEESMADIIHDELCTIREKLGIPMYGSDIEGMAVEWHKQRKIISVADIKKLYVFPKDVQRKLTSVRNAKDWCEIFSRLKDILQKKGIALSVA